MSDSIEHSRNFKLKLSLSAVGSTSKFVFCRSDNKCRNKTGTHQQE